MTYNRVLHTDDYAALEPWVKPLQEFEQRLARTGAPYRKDHQHREWEYGSILQQLEQLGVPKTARILDTGSGACYFVPYLKVSGWEGIVCSDSMDYGDITEWLRKQCYALDITVPMLQAPVQKLGTEDNYWDVVMCISTIEHLDVRVFEEGLRELYRTCKPGGYIFITSDFFESEERAMTSPCLGMQHTRFNPTNVDQKITSVLPNIEWVDGPHDRRAADVPGSWAYRGDFVNNYSFINMCFRKPLTTPGQ